MTNAEFGKALKQAKQAKGCTDADIARAVGVNKSTVGRWLGGVAQPHGRHLHLLAAFLDAPHLAVGAEGVEALEDRVIDILLDIMRRIVVGQGGVHAVERALPGFAVDGELKDRLLQDTPKLRAELNAAAGGDFETLPEPEQRRILDSVAAGHLARAKKARVLPRRDTR